MAAQMITRQLAKASNPGVLWTLLLLQAQDRHTQNLVGAVGDYGCPLQIGDFDGLSVMRN